MEIAIFPLPNVVFFPHTLLPLHIFEPRYRQMLADCLAGERRLAMALLRPPQPVPGFFEILTDRDRAGAFVDRVTSLVVQEVEERQRLLEINEVHRRLTEVTGYVEALLLRLERGTPGTRACWN
ncbi:MAG: LON peptidase substrate-binding domain-containing protein [Candidatus Methylomirabilales bacterium]